jgi:hypothetical protein
VPPSIRPDQTKPTRRRREPSTRNRSEDNGSSVVARAASVDVRDDVRGGRRRRRLAGPSPRAWDTAPWAASHWPPRERRTPGGRRPRRRDSGDGRADREGTSRHNCSSADITPDGSRDDEEGPTMESEEDVSSSSVPPPGRVHELYWLAIIDADPGPLTPPRPSCTSASATSSRRTPAPIAGQSTMLDSPARQRPWDVSASSSAARRSHAAPPSQPGRAPRR